MKKILSTSKIISLSILMFYVSCTQDDLLRDGATNEHAQARKHGFISFERLTKQIGTSAAFKDNTKYFDRNKITHAGRGGEFVEAYIDTEIIHLIETETMNFYTLRIINNNPNERSNIFYNLVFEEHLETGEVSSVIIQYHPELEWLFDRSQLFRGDIIKFDNQFISLEDLSGDLILNGELQGRIVPCSISAEWVCTVEGHPDPNGCTAGGWVIIIGPGCSTGGGSGGNNGGGDGGDGGDGGGGGGGSSNSSGSTQTVLLEICNGYTHTGEPGDSEDCEDEYADYFTPYICEVDFALINYINSWAPNNQAAATDIANYLANNFPEDDGDNCANIIDFEDPLENYDFTEESPEILIFEQDYRNDMSQAELAIFDNLSRFQQLDYLHSAYLAFFYAEKYFDNIPKVQYNGKGDAYRHALWNALGAAKLGGTLMEQLASAHEVPDPGETNNPLEKAMDLHNNQVGRDIGSQSIFMLMMKVKFAVNRGDTNYIFPTTSNGSVIPGMSQIIPTSQ